MKVLFLTNNEISMKLYEWLQTQENEMALYSDPLTIEQIMSVNPDIVISYNYRHIIRKGVIEYMKGNIINLHISLLPWNRGADPNIWSFIEDTPKGVTIHYINAGLDTGDIIAQDEVFFDETKETLRTSYEKLHEQIVALFIKNWKMMKDMTCQRKPQEIGRGSYHNTAEFACIKEKIDFCWDDTIVVFKEKIRTILHDK